MMVAQFAHQSNIIGFPPSTTVQGKSSEWYTPHYIVEAAREVMGEIDLDPASCEIANRVVKASKYYTRIDNGLRQGWHGNIWLNPPFGRVNAPLKGFGGGKSVMGMFTDKLIFEYEIGHVKQAVLLATPKIDTAWFQPLWAYPICFCNHRILFERPGYTHEGHFYGTILVYLGANEQKFIDIFSQFGTVAKRVSTPRPKVTSLSLWEVEA